MIILIINKNNLKFIFIFELTNKNMNRNRISAFSTI